MTSHFTIVISFNIFFSQLVRLRGKHFHEGFCELQTLNLWFFSELYPCINYRILAFYVPIPVQIHGNSIIPLYHIQGNFEYRGILLYKEHIVQWPSCHKVCCAWINTIRDVYIDDHFTCVMIGFPPPVWRLQMCSLALWLPSHCKEGLHETLDSALGNYFKWTSYLCLQSVTPQAPDLERQPWQERTILYLVTLLKQINYNAAVLCGEDITKAAL